jgi:hypothetical protein
MNYKYNPDSFTDVPNLRDELSNFYYLLGQYDDNKTVSNKIHLQKHGDDLFFTIKHRELEGALTKASAEDLREHMRELLYDRFYQ